MAAAARIYLDHAATTPVSEPAQLACAEALAHWFNPSSPHADGRKANALLVEARRRLATALDWQGEVIFTGGASEAIQIGIGRTKAASVITSPVEHDAVLRTCGPDAPRLEVDAAGRIKPESLVDLLSKSEKPALVAIQSVNNETGVVQDLDGLGAIVREHGGLLFADCAQSAGKLPLPDADLISLSAHKFGGPPGVGALLIKKLGLIEPTGGQEQGYRAGTENLPYILAMVAALEQSLFWLERAEELREHLDKAILAAGGQIIAGEADRISTISAYRMPGVASNAQLIQFDLAGISVSAGSACSSGTLKPSHVLSAMGLEEEAMREVVRVSFGRDTSRSDIYALVETWKAIADKAKQ